MGCLKTIIGALGIIGGLLTVLAQTPPDEARSSLSKWAEEFTALVGNSSPPTWLASPFADTVATWVGSGLFALAVAGAIVLWFRRSAATAVPLASPPPDEAAAAAPARPDQAPQEPIEPDMTMRAALYSLVGVTKPDVTAGDLMKTGDRKRDIPQASFEAAASALRQEAGGGAMQVWGRRLLALPGRKFSEIEEEIEAEYWRLARLDLFRCVTPEPGAVCGSEVEPGRTPPAEVPVYGHLRVNRRQVEQLWPEPGTFRDAGG